MGANPNTISAGIKEVWDDEYQIVHYKQPVFRAFADLTVAEKLKKGDTLHREHTSDLVVNDMGADGSYATQALTDTDETLVINKEKEVSFYIKELDELQNHLPVRMKYAKRAMNNLFLQIDGDVLGEYDQATSTVDDVVNGGSASDGITLTDANIDAVFIAAMRRLQEQNVIVDTQARFTGDVKRDKTSIIPVAAISPQMYAKLLQRLAGRDTELGDKIGQNGHAGRWMGFDLFVSNNLAWSGVLAMATNPTDDDTIVVNGVTITFQSTLTAASGSCEVHIASTVDITRANLAEFLNAGGATSETEDTDTGYSSGSAAQQALLKNIVATNDNSADTISLKVTGRSYVVVSETLTAAADIWTADRQIQHALFGTNGSISLAIQKTPNLRIKDAPSAKVGYDFITWAVYGKKVYNDQADMLVDVKIRSDAY